jgi:hypothetical protein
VLLFDKTGKLPFVLKMEKPTMLIWRIITNEYEIKKS